MQMALLTHNIAPFYTGAASFDVTIFRFKRKWMELVFKMVMILS